MQVVSGRRGRMLRVLVTLDVLRIAIHRFPNPLRVVRALHRLSQLLAAMRSGRPTCRYMKAGGRYFSHLHAPGWPSAAFGQNIEAELEAVDGARNGGNQSGLPVEQPAARLQAIIFAVTKSCSLRCKHCCEWEELNKSETLSAADIATVVARFQSLGVTQIHFSGGEPLLRLDDILATVRGARPGTDFWMFTSGVGMDRECARELKRAGITGVNISLDHWHPDLHDTFRGLTGAFEWALRAAGAAREAGLALCVTLCPTREFVSRENLQRYADLATSLGAGFIQILEPRLVGRFADSDITLAKEDQSILDRFYLEMNNDPSNAHKPIVVYPAHDQRRIGCIGAGWRYLYVDTDAQIHPCPFCRGAVGSALDPDFERHILSLRHKGCTMVGRDGACGSQQGSQGSDPVFSLMERGKQG